MRVAQVMDDLLHRGHENGSGFGCRQAVAMLGVVCSQVQDESSLSYGHSAGGAQHVRIVEDRRFVAEWDVGGPTVVLSTDVGDVLLGRSVGQVALDLQLDRLTVARVDLSGTAIAGHGDVVLVAGFGVESRLPDRGGGLLHHQRRQRAVVGGGEDILVSSGHGCATVSGNAARS